MNAPDFEDQLRALRPAAPHRSLEERIARELSRPAVSAVGRVRTEPRSLLERLLPALGWCVTGAVAATVTLLLLNLLKVHLDDIGRHGPVVENQPPAATPVSTQGEILAADDQGVYESAGQGPTRVVRYESLERRRWTDESGAITLIEVPREDVLRVPVAFQ